MNYPDNSSVSPGDIVWWNEGLNLGKVSKVLDDPDLAERIGVENLGIFVCFDLSNNTITDDVFIPECIFEDEGIGPLDPHDRMTLEKKYSVVVSNIPEKFKNYSYSAYHIVRDHSSYAWIFRFFDPNFSEIYFRVDSKTELVTAAKSEDIS